VHRGCARGELQGLLLHATAEHRGRAPGELPGLPEATAVYRGRAQGELSGLLEATAMYRGWALGELPKQHAATSVSTDSGVCICTSSNMECSLPFLGVLLRTFSARTVRTEFGVSIANSMAVSPGNTPKSLWPSLQGAMEDSRPAGLKPGCDGWLSCQRGPKSDLAGVTEEGQGAGWS